jgi:glycosyltransferase involved in cell wall biosynthesis
MKLKKYNILQFICPVGFYGAERWILALINNSNTEFVRHDLAVTEESDNQDLEIVSQFPEGEGKTHKIKMQSRFDLNAISELCRIIREREIDIIHTHGYKSDLLGLIAARKTGIKCISTPHGFGKPESLKLKLFIKIGTWSLRFFDRVVPLSRQLENEVLDFGVPQKKITYIQNGVDLTEVEAYRRGKKAKLVNETRKIGFIGQMIPRKNIRDILDTFDEVQREIPGIHLELLGDGESRQELQDYAGKLDSFSKISFLGFRNDRMEYLKNFDLFVMTSIDEGIPRCLMEAMAMEVPTVAYNIPGVDQLIKSGETGMLTSFGDTTALVKQWVELLTDADLATRLAVNARNFVNEKFSGSRMAQEYLELYKSLKK